MTETMLTYGGLAVIFVVVGAVVGLALVAGSTLILPRLINRFTPNVDEESEIIRGNRAVAEYFGRVVAAAILGASIVIAAAVAAGIIALMHGGSNTP